MSNISLGILVILHQLRVVHGVGRLACLLNTERRYVRRNAIALAAAGLIKIKPGNGRGHPTVFEDAGALERLEENAS